MLQQDNNRDLISAKPRKRKSERRSSILKVSKSPTRTALGDLDPNAQEPGDELDTKRLRRSRRVSFAETYQVKEFLKDPGWTWPDSQKTKPPDEPEEEREEEAAASSSIPSVSGLDTLINGTIQNEAPLLAGNAPVVELPMPNTSDDHIQSSQSVTVVVEELPSYTTSDLPQQAQSSVMQTTGLAASGYQVNSGSCSITDAARFQTVYSGCGKTKESIEQTNKTRYFLNSTGSSGMDMTNVSMSQSMLKDDNTTRCFGNSTQAAMQFSSMNYTLIGAGDRTRIFSNEKDMDLTMGNISFQNASHSLGKAEGRSQMNSYRDTSLITNRTRHFSEDDSMEMTACLDKSVQLCHDTSHSSERMVDARGFLQSLMNRTTQPAASSSSRATLQDGAGLGGRDDSFSVEITQCHNRTSVSETAGAEKDRVVDAKAFLSRLMTPGETSAHIPSDNAKPTKEKEFIFAPVGFDSSDSEQETKLDGRAILSRIMGTKITIPKVSSSSSDDDQYDEVFNPRETSNFKTKADQTMNFSDAGMETTKCITTKISNFSRPEEGSGKSQSSLSNRTVNFTNLDMEITRTVTLSGSVCRNSTVTSALKGERTVIFSNVDMDATEWEKSSIYSTTEEKCPKKTDTRTDCQQPGREQNINSSAKSNIPSHHLMGATQSEESNEPTTEQTKNSQTTEATSPSGKHEKTVNFTNADMDMTECLTSDKLEQVEARAINAPHESREEKIEETNCITQSIQKRTHTDINVSAGTHTKLNNMNQNQESKAEVTVKFMDTDMEMTNCLPSIKPEKSRASQEVKSSFSVSSANFSAASKDETKCAGEISTKHDNTGKQHQKFMNLTNYELELNKCVSTGKQGGIESVAVDASVKNNATTNLSGVEMEETRCVTTNILNGIDVTSDVANVFDRNQKEKNVQLQTNVLLTSSTDDINKLEKEGLDFDKSTKTLRFSNADMERTQGITASENSGRGPAVSQTGTSSSGRKKVKTSILHNATNEDNDMDFTECQPPVSMRIELPEVEKRISDFSVDKGCRKEDTENSPVSTARSTNIGVESDCKKTPSMMDASPRSPSEPEDLDDSITTTCCRPIIRDPVTSDEKLEEELAAFLSQDIVKPIHTIKQSSQVGSQKQGDVCCTENKIKQTESERISGMIANSACSASSDLPDNRETSRSLETKMPDEQKQDLVCVQPAEVQPSVQKEIVVASKDSHVQLQQDLPLDVPPTTEEGQKYEPKSNDSDSVKTLEKSCTPLSNIQKLKKRLSVYQGFAPVSRHTTTRRSEPVNIVDNSTIPAHETKEVEQNKTCFVMNFNENHVAGKQEKYKCSSSGSSDSDLMNQSIELVSNSPLGPFPEHKSGLDLLIKRTISHVCKKNTFTSVSSAESERNSSSVNMNRTKSVDLTLNVSPDMPESGCKRMVLPECDTTVPDDMELPALEPNLTMEPQKSLAVFEMKNEKVTDTENKELAVLVTKEEVIHDSGTNSSVSNENGKNASKPDSQRNTPEKVELVASISSKNYASTPESSSSLSHLSKQESQLVMEGVDPETVEKARELDLSALDEFLNIKSVDRHSTKLNSMLEPKMTQGFSMLSAIEEGDNASLCMSHMSLSVVDLLKGCGIITDVRPVRRSTLVPLSVAPVETMSQKLQQIATLQPQLHTYSWACDWLSEHNQELSHTIEETEKYLQEHPPPSFEHLKSLSGAELQELENLKERNIKMVQKHFKKWRCKMVSSVLQSIEDEEEHLKTAYEDLISRNKQLDDLLQLVVQAEHNLDEKIEKKNTVHLEGTAAKDEDPVQTQGESAPVISQVKFVTFSSEEETDSEEEATKMVTTLDRIHVALATLQNYERFPEWYLAEWEENQGVFSFFYKSMVLTVHFGAEMPGALVEGVQHKKIENLELRSRLSENADSSAYLAHAYLKSWFDTCSPLRMCSDTTQLPRFLQEMSRVASSAEFLQEDVYNDFKHLLNVKDTSVTVTFCNIKVYKKFYITFTFPSPNYPRDRVVWTLQKDTGALQEDKLAAAIENVSPGPHYYTRLVAATEIFLQSHPRVRRNSLGIPIDDY